MEAVEAELQALRQRLEEAEVLREDQVGQAHVREQVCALGRESLLASPIRCPRSRSCSHCA